MISTNNLSTGITIVVDGELFTVLEFLHVKPGKGPAFVRTKLRNIRTGSTIERTFRAAEKVEKAHLESREMQYLYRSGVMFTFMDTATYEQTPVNEDTLGDRVQWLKENEVITIVTYQGEIVGIDLPIHVALEVTQTDPGVRGDTATGGSKPATLETGAVVQVPLFINEGDVIKVDTRTGNYVERVT